MEGERRLVFSGPFTCDKCNKLMRLLKNGEHLTVDGIKHVIEENPLLVMQIYSGKRMKAKTVLYYALYKGCNSDANRVKIMNYLIEKGAGVGAMWEGGDTPLQWCVKHNCVEVNCINENCRNILEYLLEKGADPNCRDENHCTPLHYVLRQGKEDCIRLLLEKGANPNENDYLHYAARMGNEGCVQALIEKRADINRNSGEWGFMPLHEAVHNGKVACARLLLENGAYLNGEDTKRRTPLHIAAEKGEDACVALLLDAGAELNHVDACGKVPLHYAAIEGHDTCAELLLKKGADPNQSACALMICEDKEGILGGGTPMHYAAACGHDGCVRVLIKNRANPQKVNTYGETPLHLAAQRGRSACVELLLRACDPNQGNNYGITPLHMAARWGSEDCVRLLLDCGANPNKCNIYGTSPLHYAVRGESVSCVGLLLRKGANPNQRNNNNETPLDWGVWSGCGADWKRSFIEDGNSPDLMNTSCGWTLLHHAAWHGFMDSVRLLVEKSADLNHIDESGMTPLHEAVVRLLIKEGADPNVRDNFGESPLDLAKKGNHEIIVKMLELNEAKKSTEDTSTNQPTHIMAPSHTKTSKGTFSDLFVAVRADDIGKVRSLIESGVDPNCVNEDGDTPLHIAAKNGNEACVRVFLKKVNLNQGNKWGNTPLHFATDGGCVSCVELLLKEGADPNCVNKAEQRPLDVCTDARIEALLKTYGGKKSSDCIIM